ncbi:MAG: hypothetical protein FJ358_00290 [Thaumarchaeota archaeon]|nr:hypothetical protein [Nitrososphaerota archaeon]
MVANDIIEQCFTLIIEKKFQQAKELVSQNMRNTKSNRVMGSAFAIDGLISIESAKLSALPHDSNDVPKFRRILNEKESSIWSDDFDKGYFATWKKFLKFADEKGLLEQQRVVENPSKEEEHDEGS